LNKGKQKDITYFPLWRERGTIRLRRMVESRILYVGIRECKRMLHMAALFIKTFLILPPTAYL
jgi:hypothetical protein